LAAMAICLYGKFSCAVLDRAGPERNYLGSRWTMERQLRGHASSSFSHSFPVDSSRPGSSVIAASRSKKLPTLTSEINARQTALSSWLRGLGWLILPHPNGGLGAYKFKVRRIFLIILSLLLCSCADFSSPPGEPAHNRCTRPGSGDIE
jgi:hypothetical protein